jgi:LmbE family N-acetylglucosaminyl deacetylase
MQKLILGGKRTDPLKVLCLGAHCDDIEIGCGGTIFKLIKEFSGSVNCQWIVLSSNSVRASEAQKCAESFLSTASEKQIEILSFRDGFFPAHWAEIKEVFEKLKSRFDPHIVFTHYRDDRHQDHRVVSDLTWNTYRNHLILEYEIPKYDGDLGTPNVFVELGEDLVKTKTRLILEAFTSQQGKHWFTENTLRALMRIRGVECSSNNAYAEAFYGRKIIL